MAKWKNKQQGYMLDGTEQGTWHLDSLGNKVEETNFLRGRLHGKSTIYYTNGKKHIESNYKLNQLHGMYTEWDEAGYIKVQGYYKNHQRDSSWKYFYPNTNLMQYEYIYKPRYCIVMELLYREVRVQLEMVMEHMRILE
jgi:antitoxin component YwqK of YwqJK toxin-antitoxin module